MAPHLGTQIRQKLCTGYHYPGKASSFALKTGKATGCALCPSDTVSRTVGWALCSLSLGGFLVQVGQWLHLAISVSLPSCSWEDSSKAGKAVCGLTETNLCPKFPGLTRATTLALGVISSAHLPLGSSIDGLHSSFQVFSSSPSS